MATTTASRSLALGRNALLKPLGAAATCALLALVGLAITVQLPNVSPLTAIVAIAIGSAAAFLFFSERYEWTLAVLMLYIGLADGYLKLKTGSSNATLLRDVFLYAIAAGALIRFAVRREELVLPPLSGWVFAWVFVVAIQIFNPYSGSTAHGLASVRQHLEWVPLFFFAYVVMRSQARIQAFLLILLAIAACNGVVGVIQSNLTPEQLSSWGPGYADAISGEGEVSKRTFADSEGNERNRPFALGGDFGFGGTLGMIAVPAALGLLALSKRRNMRILVALLSIGAVLGIASSQARTAVIGSVVAAFAFAALTVTSRGGLRTVLSLGAAVVIVYITLGILSSNSETAKTNRYESISNPTKAVSTAYDYRRDVISQVPNYLVEIPLGAGLGSKGPATSVGGGTEKGKKYNGESEPTFLIIELGIPGFIVMLAFNLILFYISITRIRRIPDREMRILLTAVAAPLFAIFATWFVGIATASTPSAPYMWFAAGTLSFWLLGKGRDEMSGRPGWSSG